MGRRRAFDDGEDDGRGDPRALRSGSREGEKAALARGQASWPPGGRRPSSATCRREPRRIARPPREPLPPNLVRVRERAPEEVFGDVSIGSYLSYENFDDYVDPWRLYQAASWGAVYDDDWESDRRAFDHWRDRGEDAIWDRAEPARAGLLPPHLRRPARLLAVPRAAPYADRAYRDGYDDGWDYGSEVGAEFRYRQGYREGFLAAGHRRRPRCGTGSIPRSTAAPTARSSSCGRPRRARRSKRSRCSTKTTTAFSSRARSCGWRSGSPISAAAR